MMWDVRAAAISVVYAPVQVDETFNSSIFPMKEAWQRECCFGEQKTIDKATNKP